MRKILCALLGLILTLPVFAACPSGQVEQTYTSATGTVTQNGTPTPTNPIEPVFYQQGNMILRKVGDIADSYDATTGKITRRIGVKALDGTEDWHAETESFGVVFTFIPVPGAKGGVSNPPMCSHFKTNNATGTSNIANLHIGWSANLDAWIGFRDDNIQQLNDWKSYLVQQAANGTPVTVYYPLATETTEDWNETTYCITPIKIATTAYNSARFSPVVTELNDTIATIRSVVTNTINQTKAIADLQATKQTRPDETCPAGKKCLLVEDNDGQPHWYEIIESANRLPDGYIERQYIYMMDGSYIKVEDLPISAGYRVEFDFQTTTLSSALRNYLGGRASDVAAGGGFRLSKLASGGTTLNRVVLYGFESGTEYYDPTAQFQANTRYKYTYDNGVCTLESGGSVVSTQTFTVTDTTSTPWGINIYHGSGGWGTSGTSDGIYVYSLRVWNAQGELVMDLIPAENSSGVVGMYDTVSGTFKTATAGTFEAGPEI